MTGPVIGYDASAALAASAGGVGRYVRELLRALVAGAPPSWRWVVLLNSLRGRPGPDFDFLRVPAVQIVRRRLPGPAVVEGWRRLGVPSWESLVRRRCGAVLAPASYMPPARCPVLLTVHDLAFLRDPGPGAPLGAAYFRETFPRALPHAARVLTPSRFVAADVASHYPAVPPERIAAVPSGLGEAFLADAEPLDASERATLGLGPRYVLAVTDPSVRKRPELLRESWQRFGAEGVRLGVLGLPAEALPAGAVALPRVSDAMLARLYAGAAAVVLTTREEGFGFPLLEALACGAPVVAGRHSSLAEIGGAHPRWVSEESAEGFAEALREALTSPPDDAARAAARAHARSFTWQRTAAEVLGVIDKVMESPGKRS